MASYFDDSYSAAFQNQYGNAADKAAQKYGIPVDKFRGMINDISGFDPYNVRADGGGGLAGLKADNFKGVDIYNPESALDTAAKVVSSIFSQDGKKSWDGAINDYKEMLNGGLAVPVKENEGSKSVIDKLGDYFGSDDEEEPDDKPFWQYGMTDVKSFFQESIFSLLFGIIGVILILGSVYALFRAAPVVISKTSK